MCVGLALGYDVKGLKMPISLICLLTHSLRSKTTHTKQAVLCALSLCSCSDAACCNHKMPLALVVGCGKCNNNTQTQDGERKV